jgi:hypothetical protein
VPGDPEHDKHFLAIGIVSTVIRMLQKELTTVITIYHHEYALLSDR